MNSPPHRPKEQGAKGNVKDSAKRSDHGIERNQRGEEQPTDKGRAQQTSNVDESARQPPSPGQPAGGE